MEWQRIVELHDRRSGRFGTGYLLAPALVLTARHVVEGLNAMQARLFEADEDGLPGAIGPRLEARVVWSGPPDLDLALLAPVDSEASFRVGVMPVLIARLADRAAVRVDALGFPQAMDSPAHADTLHVEALVSAWSGLRGSSLVMEVQTARPQNSDAWKGMSGAAVFAGDRIVGAVEAVPALLADGALKAARADLLFNQEAAAALLSASEVRLSEPIDAAYVDALPRAGHWSGVREQYARSVVTNLCRIDHVGIAVGGAPDRRTPALAAYTAQRLATWPPD
jgi:hypothetical protein